MRNGDFFGAVAARLGRERDTDGIADPFLQQDRETGGTSDHALHPHPRFGQAQVQRVVCALSERAIDVHQILYSGNLGTQDDPVML